MSKNKEHNCIDYNKLLADIENFGWTVLLVEATDYLPSFAYTIGLWKNYHHAELISFGLTKKTLHIILNDVGERIKSGEIIQIGKAYNDIFENSRTKFLSVNERSLSDYFGYAINFYKDRTFPAIQLVWTDRNDHFPWHKDFEKEFVFRQPLLDRNADFKFRESKNLAVFTTRQWLELNKPILRVIHEFDGDWQFLTGDQLSEDARLVCLEEMTLRDNTLNDVFNLDYGEAAEREFLGGLWKRTNIDDDD